jgi:uncharacterized membrane protein
VENGSFVGEGRIGLQVAARRFEVVPGAAVLIRAVLRNQGADDDFFELSVRGVPLGWVSIPSPVTWLEPDQTREVGLTIRLPPYPQAPPGEYRLLLRVTSQEDPEQSVSVPCRLVVTREEEEEPAGEVAAARGRPRQAGPTLEGDVTLHLPAAEVSVTPGSTAILPIVLINRSAQEDALALSVDGLPAEWVTVPGPIVRLGAGMERRLEIAIQPPRSVGNRAGRYPVRVRSHSQVNGLLVERRCTLTVAAFSEFSAELDPEWMYAGETGKISIENEGNIQDAFSLRWQSLNDELEFEPGPRQALSVPAGQNGEVQFQAWPRQRPLLGGARGYPYTVQVRSSDEETLSLRGEVLGRAMIPGWLAVVIVVVVLAFACAALGLLLVALGLWEGLSGLTPGVVG